jgi:putative addiction module component (TIGR02574 family)
MSRKSAASTAWNRLSFTGRRISVNRPNPLVRGSRKTYNSLMGSELNHLEELPLAERIQLVEDLWDSIARTNGEDLPVPDWQKAELERRKQNHARDPGSAMPWSEVKRSILGSLRMG